MRPTKLNDFPFFIIISLKNNPLHSLFWDYNGLTY
jgi:hypothetical protein